MLVVVVVMVIVMMVVEVFVELTNNHFHISGSGVRVSKVKS